MKVFKILLALSMGWLMYVFSFLIIIVIYRSEATVPEWYFTGIFVYAIVLISSLFIHMGYSMFKYDED